MENSEIAAVFEELGNLLRILQDDLKWQFKAAAYDRARRAIESCPEPLESILRDPSRSLTEIPGVGADLAQKIEELITTGRLEYHQQQLQKLPKGLLELLQLQSVGPQKVRLFHQQLGVTGITELQEAAQAGRLRALPGMSAKSEKNILEAIEVFSRAAGRFRLDVAYSIAEELSSFLRGSKLVERVTAAGSLRRGCETVGDLDLLVIGREHSAIAEHFVGHARIAKVLAKGEDKVSVKLDSGMQVDVRMLDRESYGAALMYFTGSKEHNVALRERARRMGLKLSEYGLFKGDKSVAGTTEEEVYEKLGLRWIPPEIRERAGEIEAAENDTLPALVELSDIQGDLQMHTVASDGHASIEGMAAAAKRLGYRYILITDHSKAVTVANGLDENRAVDHIARIRSAREKVKDIEIWAGTEVDILEDGRLDYPDSLLQQFDVVLASVHSRMTQGSAEMTSRLLKALANPYVKILGHPTGRRLLRRESFKFDIDAVFDAARAHGVVLEINANPERLDLCDRHARAARDKGVKVIISTDAHRPEHLQFMRYGVATARRGWIEKKDVLNALPPAQLLASLRPLPK